MATNTPPKRKPKRNELKPGEVLCDYCTAKCCRYFALPIETPTTRKDFDFCRWYLMHKGATIFTEDETWYLCVHADCKHLQEDQRCGIYESRPQVCRDYSTTNCEYDGNWTYDRYFETSEQIWEYAEAVLGPQARSPEPPAFPVLSLS